MKGIPGIIPDRSGREVAGMIRPTRVLPDGRSRGITFTPFGGLNTSERQLVTDWIKQNRPDFIHRLYSRKK